METQKSCEVENSNPQTSQGIADEIIDIEEYAKTGQKPPKNKHYRIKIDKEKYVVDVPFMTGRQLLELAGKIPPEQYMMIQKLHGGKRERIELDEEADFTTPGVETFETMAIDPTEG